RESLARSPSLSWSLALASLRVATATVLALQVAQLVLADLDLVAVGKQVRLDPAPVHVGAVQRAEIVDVEAVLAAHDQRVVARDRHVVEKDGGVGGAPDRHPVAGDREALTGAASAR